MLSSVFAEDIFLDFYHLVLLKNLPIQGPDYSPIASFGEKISLGEKITQNQANYIIKILEKYKNISAQAGLDYKSQLSSIQWKYPFRVLDLTKKIYAEKDETGKFWVCLKFPYQLKKEFDEEILSDNEAQASSKWDSEERVRKISLYDCNLIQLYEFATKHNFVIDETFMCVLSDVEEIWQHSDNLIPKAIALQHDIILQSASEETNEYFLQNKTGSFFNDLFLAKSMGYPLVNLGRLTGDSGFSQLLKIASANQNSFWIKSNEDFFQIYKILIGKVCIILDRAGSPLTWLQNFVADADKNGVSRDDIKVCFRENKDNVTGLNEWIKIAGVGGKVETGRILIFESKPAKWLFKDQENVKMLVTNAIYPPTNSLTRDWFQSHPCVIYLGDTKPTEQKGYKIVEL